MPSVFSKWHLFNNVDVKPAEQSKEKNCKIIKKITEDISVDSDTSISFDHSDGEITANIKVKINQITYNAVIDYE